MKKGIPRIASILIIILLLSSGCAKKSDTARVAKNNAGEKGMLKVYTSFYPYYDFAKKIGGDRIELHTIIPIGVEPHSFEPSSKIIAQLEQADVFIYNGVHMEPWIEKVLSLLEGKNIYFVDAGRSVELISYDEKHGNNNNGEHHHGEYDPHIWVDPINAIHISEEIKNAFLETDNENSDIYEKNFDSFKKELEGLDTALREGLKGAVGRKIIVSHSAFGYLAKRYDIEQIAVAGVSPHAEPSPKRLAQLIKIAKDNKINYILLESLTSVKTAEILAEEAGLEVLTLYIVEGLTEEQKNNGEDYISLMYKNIETLKKALVE